MGANKKLSLIGYGISACIFLVITLWMTGVLGSYTGSEMAVWLLGLYLTAPITSLVTGVYFGLKDAFLKWLYPVVFGIWGYTIPCLATGSFRFEVISLFFAFVPALLGIIIGMLAQKIKARKEVAK